jgi:pyridoxal phosphate enzyme (YggS family)
MTSQTTILDNLQTVQAQIATLERRHGRAEGSVRLLAVSKTKPFQMVQLAAQSGQRAFGENYIEEGIDKQTQLADPSLEWHFIGNIQSNKTRLVARHYQWVQSVDRQKIVNRLSAQRPEELPPLNVCIQLNIDAETTKAGCQPAEIDALSEAIAEAPQLVLRGLMAIPAPRHTLDEQREVFARLHDIYRAMQQQHARVDTLSTGMSADMEAAIAEGSTMVRIGTAIFGQRDYQK